ncbi:DICT sensory domain-containing protein [Halorubrum sp. AJ67]|uniref:DICT sensory domain-containing protein n=1 Tax=Halorubrum sp. AJ67 TaxID=1173487 RepID=UPI0003DBBD8F|nr:DICT sensory domain-containing protein [Halorubrum sp. AJ67]CDK40369.1 putative sensor protein [Halorubrum sp. AJ67]
MVDSIRDFFAEIENPDRNLVVLDQSSPEPVRNMLNSLVEDQLVSLTQLDAEDTDSIRGEADTRVVALVENGNVLARSSVNELLESVLLINSDLYKTGAIDLGDVVLPDVLKGLDEVPFRVRGYPESHNEKLLLIVISRVIERIASETGGGTLRASFQRLSRLYDEKGTYEVYDTLSKQDVDIHIYGVCDIEPSKTPPVTVHTGDTYVYKNSWFVVFTPPAGSATSDYAALVALEAEPNVWNGFWTFRPELVTQIETYLTENV